ncbi:MAG TPA: helix-turn-helix domain-containing protein [Acidimicrobiales bacterium]|nr:helix-turn-helix domain-containing protein [Acidimicrobiales bacterium]
MPKPSIPDDLLQQGHALGDPTRHGLFRYIADADRPVGVAELTEYAGLNHNAVRQHLTVLRQAGLVEEEMEVRRRPGRPRLLYRLSPEAAGSWGTTGPFELLASALAEALASGEGPYRVGVRLGRRRAQQIDSHRGETDPAEVLRVEMLERGFRPTLKRKGERLEYSLQRCPFSSVAEQSPQVVCELHRGLMDGLAEELGEPVQVVEFAPRRTKRQACRVVAETG